MCSRLVNANLVLAHSIKNRTRGGEELKISKAETVSRPKVLPRSEKIILIGEVIIQIIQLMCSRLVNANMVLAHSIKNSTRGGEELKFQGQKLYLGHRYYLTVKKLFKSVTSLSI